MASLIDTNVLVYRFDPRVPQKQRVAEEILRRCIAEDSGRLPHQAIVEFFAVVTRPIPSFRAHPQSKCFTRGHSSRPDIFKPRQT